MSIQKEKKTTPVNSSTVAAPEAAAATLEPATESKARRPRGRPRQVPLEEQREKILATATRLFATDGFDGVTSERIAEASGVGRPTVYQLFGSKNDVFLAAIDRAFARILAHVRQGFGTTVHLRGRKQAVANIASYFEIVTQEPDTFQMLLLADRSGDAPTREAAKAIRSRMQDAVAGYMRTTWEGFQDLAERDATLAATMIAAAVEAAAVYHLERPDR